MRYLLLTLYGLQEQTLNSLVIAHITVKQERGSAHVECINISPSGEPVMTVLNKYLLSPSSDVSCSCNRNFIVNICLSKGSLICLLNVLLKS